MASFDNMTDMLGDSLRAPDGSTVSTADALKDKIIGLYFSAHWCPPCRGFTPKLAEHYMSAYKAKGMEIVFVSSDKNEEQFAEYAGEMPWLSLPFADREREAALSKRFKVSGIPTLVILDVDGSTITTDGRSAVSDDPEGASFPWRPKPLSELLGGDSLAFEGKDGATYRATELASKHLLLYFSAHWCPPCRGFTPKLAEHYKAYKAAGLDVECVFISSDRDEKQFAEYFSEMPWLALPFADRERKAALSKHFDVSGIPSLVVLGPVDEVSGERPVVNRNARGAVGGDATGADFPWGPKPMEDLATTAEANGSDINETPALVALLEGCDDDTQADAKAAMLTVATELATEGKARADGPVAICFFACESKGVVPRVRQLCSLATPGDRPTLVLLDIPDSGGFYVCKEDELTVEAIRGFIKSFESGDLKSERQQLKG